MVKGNVRDLTFISHDRAIVKYCLYHKCGQFSTAYAKRILYVNRPQGSILKSQRLFRKLANTVFVQENWTDILDELLEGTRGESDTLEVKSFISFDKNSREVHDVFRTISAFANCQGGLLFFGLAEPTDEDSGYSVLGCDACAILEYLEQNIEYKISAPGVLRLHDSKYYRIDEREGKRVLIVQVETVGVEEKPVFFKKSRNTKSAYVRIGSSDRTAPLGVLQQFDLERLLALERREWDGDLVSLDDADPQNLSPFTQESIRYFQQLAPEIYRGLKPLEVLHKVNAVKLEDGIPYWTKGGLLAFGTGSEIRRFLPTYFLDYSEQIETDPRNSYRIVTNDSSWSGNLIDFYRRVYQRFQSYSLLATHGSLGGEGRLEDTPDRAFREAIVNALIHCFYASLGNVKVEVQRNRDGSILLRNTGSFLIPIEKAIEGGREQGRLWRNPTIALIFASMNLVEQQGFGVHRIFDIHKKYNLGTPQLTQDYERDTGTSLRLFPEDLQSMPTSLHRALKGFPNAIDRRVVIVLYYAQKALLNTEVADRLSVTGQDVSYAFRRLLKNGVVSRKGQPKSYVYELSRDFLQSLKTDENITKTDENITKTPESIRSNSEAFQVWEALSVSTRKRVLEIYRAQRNPDKEELKSVVFAMAQQVPISVVALQALFNTSQPNANTILKELFEEGALDRHGWPYQYTAKRSGQ